MSLIIWLQKIYAKYLSIDFSKDVDYGRKPGLDDVLAVSEKYGKIFSDDLERSLAQYRCSIVHLTRAQRALINIAACVLLIPYYIKCCSKGRGSGVTKADAVFLVADHISDRIIPNELKTRFPVIKKRVPEMSCLLSKGARCFYLQVVRESLFHPFFHLKVLVKLGFLDSAIQEYHPSAVIHNTESSFACSVLARYCELNGIDYIGVMHGEYLVNPKDCFFRCTQFYVWDKYYAHMLSKIGAEPNQFVVATPPCLEISCDRDRMPTYDYVYYLQRETEAELKVLKSVFDCLQGIGYRLRFRPHPKFFDEASFQKVFGKSSDLLDCLSFEESLASTLGVIAKFSTVLLQGSMAGKTVVIDDISNPDVYRYLQRAGYIMLDKPHFLLSDLCNTTHSDDNDCCDNRRWTSHDRLVERANARLRKGE